MSGQLKTPFIGVLPPLAPDEFEALRASIEAEGVRDDIVVDEDGNIIDGHHRYQIDPNAPRRVVTGLTEAAKRALVINYNMTRRNLSGEQKAALRNVQKDIAVQLKREGWTQKQIARALGAAQQTVSDMLRFTNTGSGNTKSPHPEPPPNGTFAVNGIEIDETGSPTIVMAPVDDPPPPAPLPDNRAKLTAEQKAEIVRRVMAGEMRKDIASEFGVSPSTISNLVKTAQGEGKKNGSPPPAPQRSVKVPDGMTAEALCRKGMAMEDAGKSSEAAAKEIGIGVSAYRAMRDIVLLSDRDDLSVKDAAAVKAALADMNATRQVSVPHESIQHIAIRVWGTDRGGSKRVQAEARRIERFEGALGVIIQACAEAEQIDLPYLSADRAAYFASELEKGEKNLRRLRQRIKEIHQ